MEVWILNHWTTKEVPVLLLLDLGINEVIHIVILCVWLSLFNKMSLRFNSSCCMHPIVHSFCCMRYLVVWMCNFFTHSVNRHLDCFDFSAIVNTVALDVLVHVF